MKRVPAEKTILVWPYHPTLKEQQHLRDLRKENKSGKKSEDEKQTPEQMIHSLQGIFCGGRYRSWVFSSKKPITKTTLQPPAGGRR